METEVFTPKVRHSGDLIALLQKVKEASHRLAHLSTEKKNQVLRAIQRNLKDQQSSILEANEEDVHLAQSQQLSPALIDRLRLDEKRIEGMIQAVGEIVALADPVGEVVKGYTLPNGLEFKKVRVPLGVIGVIYESRPNVTIDIAALGIKSGNAVVLRGGKEALRSNQMLLSVVQKALKEMGLDPFAVSLIDNPDRALVPVFLKQKELVDLMVPRGGEELIRFVEENATIPVVKHDKGVCTLYIEKTADPAMAESIAVNAKVQRPSVCNAIENLIIDKGYPHAEDLLQTLQGKGVKLLGDQETQRAYPNLGIEPLWEGGYGVEYLDLILAVKQVDGMEEAIRFIQTYSSRHSDAIITNDYRRAREFVERVDSAAVFVNCSTRFHDGGQMGMGAEVGISTNKLHVRGPMGLADLTTTKIIVEGEGQIRS